MFPRLMLEVDSDMLTEFGGIAAVVYTESFFSIKALVVKTEDAVAWDKFLRDDTRSTLTREKTCVAIVLNHLQSFLYVPCEVRTTLR